MQCPYCGGDAAVLDSRNNSEGVRRRRSCGDCKRRFTTYEKVASPAIRVTKRTGKTEPFDSDKVAKILVKVGRDRPDMGEEEARRLAKSVEAQILDAAVKSISSAEIVNLVLDLLKGKDKLAYDRLAANYLTESGALNTSPSRQEDGGQLGLFVADEEASS